MKILLIIGLLISLSTSLFSNERMCEVEVCNKIKRFSLNPLSHLKDKFGEACFNITLSENEAQEGKILNSESRWYQGSSINPTKKSVTYIKKILKCQ